jgi:hypothetical protein
MTTNIGTNNPVTKKSWSETLSYMCGREPTPLKSLTGPMPTEDETLRKSSQQSSNWMPVVRVDELTKTAGDRVQVDCAQISQFVAIMGDENAEGRGPDLNYSTQELVLNMATLPVSAGGAMSQQRTVHDLRKRAIKELSDVMPRFRWQRSLVHMAGARGSNVGVDWVLAPDVGGVAAPTLALQMVNPVRAPTYNRHFVVSAGGTLVQGGAQLASVLTTDVMRLSVVDEFAAIWSEMTIRMLPIKIPGDPAAGDAPIKGVLFMDQLVWDNFVTDTTAASNIRKWEADALRRADYGNLRAHPLFSGQVMLWNDILIRRMNFPIRFGANDTVPHVTVGNRLTATETNVTVAAGLSTTHAVSRSIFLGAQALAVVSGGNKMSQETYHLLEKHTDNFGRNHEFAGELMGSEAKLRWNFPDGLGNNEPTDFGVAVIDSVVRRRPN